MAKDQEQHTQDRDHQERGARLGRGTLIIIGGHEDKERGREILKEVARHVDGGRLVIATVASHKPEGYFESYQQGFDGLNVGELTELYIDERPEASHPEKLALFDGARGVFFSGGDQLRITSQIGDTPLEARIREVYERGGVVAGTSAGASVMCETMLVKGPSRESYRIGDLQMAPGLGLVRGVIIDQHFAERGRMGRLLGAVAQNPRVLGIGIDEDTAIVLQGGHFRVIGSGAVYVADGAGITHSNIAEARTDEPLSLYDVRLHVLSAGDAFDLNRRAPLPARDLDSGAAQ
ncbi:cyanophycinase [Deinococcus multiflagellatus]|uniref:cyanophycinase n=1 Tax=Deinococcus multiflagellatus TaxID=1656887 RepID=UPI001CC90FA0|nr:cyanophycinase [Deinococcus multiflagellatus]MBZ9714296.1 cyanophycinase [Deinococcus multiflagellatus]